MWKRLALWYLLRRAHKRKGFYNAELERMSIHVANDETWLFNRLAEFRNNNVHAIHALKSVRDMEGT